MCLFVYMCACAHDLVLSLQPHIFPFPSLIETAFQQTAVEKGFWAACSCLHKPMLTWRDCHHKLHTPTSEPKRWHVAFIFNSVFYQIHLSTHRQSERHTTHADVYTNIDLCTTVLFVSMSASLCLWDHSLHRPTQYSLQHSFT